MFELQRYSKPLINNFFASEWFHNQEVPLSFVGFRGRQVRHLLLAPLLRTGVLNVGFINP